MVTQEKQIEQDTAAVKASLQFANNADFIFAPHYSTQNVAAIKYNPSTSLDVTLNDDTQNQKFDASKIAETTWSITKPNSSDSVAGAPTLSNQSSNSVTVTANASTAAQINSFDDGVDVVALVKLTDGKIIRVRKRLYIIALNPEHADKGDLGTRSLKLTETPPSLTNAITNSKLENITFWRLPIANVPGKQDGDLDGFTKSDLTYTTPELTYLNNGDVYQLSFDYNGKTYCSNPAQIVINERQPPTIYSAPDLDFTDQTAEDDGAEAQGKPTLSRIISGYYSVSGKALSATGQTMFSFGAHVGAVNWTVSAQMTPFVNTADQKPISTSDSTSDSTPDGVAQMTTIFTPNTSGSDVANAGLSADKLSSKGAVVDDNSPTVIYSGHATGNFTLYGQLQANLRLAKAPSARIGDYTSTVTWTTGTAANTPAAK